MTNRSLSSCLRSLADLVSESGWTTQATYLRDWATTIAGADRAAAQAAAADFIRHASGMGSLSDLSLNASDGLSRPETYSRYVDELDRAVLLAKAMVT